MRDLFNLSEEKTLGQWWAVVGINFVVGIILYGLFIASSLNGSPNPFLSFIIVVVGLAMGVVQIAADVNRLRDGGFSPYLIFLIFVPAVGGLIIFILCGFMPSR